MTREPTWRTSSFSSNGSNCVEVLELADGTWLRDTKDRGGPALHCDDAGWRAFLAAVAAGDAHAGTPADGPGTWRLRPAGDGGCLVEDVAADRALEFTGGEWAAFRAGVQAGEFDPAPAGRGA